MRLDYQIRPQARAEIDEACEWYESQNPGRGDEFLVELHERIDDIRNDPYSSCLISSKVRAVRLKRSKFIVYFRIEPTLVRILAVQHASANPEKRRGRK